MIDWLLWAILVVAVVLLIPATGLDYTLQHVWSFRRRGWQQHWQKTRAQWLARLGRPQHYPIDLREVRDFIISLQLGTSMDETLSGALSHAAQQFKNRGIFGRRLLRRVETQLSIAPEEVIKGLATDFASDDLRDLAQRLEMARDGGISYERALSLSIALVEEELRGNLQRDIQQTPIQLTVPMIVGVFLPAIIIGIFPLVLNVLGILVTPGGG